MYYVCSAFVNCIMVLTELALKMNNKVNMNG